MFELWLTTRRCADDTKGTYNLDSAGVTENLRERFFGRYFKTKQASFAEPTCPDLKAGGEKRPLWLSVILFFFSRDFADRAFKAGLWPLSLYLHDERSLRCLGSMLSLYVLLSLVTV